MSLNEEIREEYKSILAFKDMATEMVLTGNLSKRHAIKMVVDFKGERMKKIRKINARSISGWHQMDDECRYKKEIVPYTIEDISAYMGSSDNSWKTTNVKSFPVQGKTVLFIFQQKFI